MSVVVAIKTQDNVFMGCDSQVTRGGCRMNLTNKNNFKVWKVNGVDNCIIGSVGNLRDACVVRIMHGLISDIEVFRDQIDFSFVVSRIVPRIIEELKYYGYVKNDSYFTGLDSRFLFAYKDMLFLINNDGSVVEIDECIAIGSGENEAIGSLITTKDDEDTSGRIIKAIMSSAAHDIYVDYPIVITNTQDTEFVVLNEQDLKVKNL